MKQAHADLAHVVERDPGYTQALSNQVLVSNDLGRGPESLQLAARLKQLDPEPAFSHFNRGLVAMQDGNVRMAREAARYAPAFLTPTALQGVPSTSSAAARTAPPARMPRPAPA